MRAVRETADLLKKDGHDVVEVRRQDYNLKDCCYVRQESPFQFHPPPMDDVQRLYLGFTMADWGYELKKACSMDLYDSSTLLLRTASLIFSLPRITQYFIKWIMSLLSKTMMPGNAGHNIIVVLIKVDEWLGPDVILTALIM